MRHYTYALWYNLAQVLKSDIYLKLWYYAQNCLICTLHPLYCEKKLSIRYGTHGLVKISCSHCHVDDVMNDIISCSYSVFILNVYLLNCCGRCMWIPVLGMGCPFWGLPRNITVWLWRHVSFGIKLSRYKFMNELGLLRHLILCNLFALVRWTSWM